jgi:hypothetical protein
MGFIVILIVKHPNAGYLTKIGHNFKLNSKLTKEIWLNCVNNIMKNINHDEGLFKVEVSHPSLIEEKDIHVTKPLFTYNKFKLEIIKGFDSYNLSMTNDILNQNLNKVIIKDLVKSRILIIKLVNVCKFIGYCILAHKRAREKIKRKRNNMKVEIQKLTHIQVNDEFDIMNSLYKYVCDHPSNEKVSKKYWIIAKKGYRWDGFSCYIFPRILLRLENNGYKCKYNEWIFGDVDNEHSSLDEFNNKLDVKYKDLINLQTNIT